MDSADHLVQLMHTIFHSTSSGPGTSIMALTLAQEVHIMTERHKWKVPWMSPGFFDRLFQVEKGKGV